MDSILDSVGSIVGVGKSAAVEKENAKLKAENERIRKAFPNAVKNKVEELTKVLASEKQEAETERDRALALNRSLTMERDKAVRQLQEQKDGERQRISQAVLEATEEKDKTIRLLQGALKNSKRILNLNSRHAVSCERGIQTGCHGDYPFRNGAAQVNLCPVRSRRH